MLNTDHYFSLLIVMPLAALISWLLRFLFARWRYGSPLMRSALATPVVLIPWVLCALYSLHLIDEHIGRVWHDWLGTTESLISVVYPVWMILRVLKQLPKIPHSGWFKAIDRDVVYTLSRFFQILVVILAVLLMAQKMGYSLSALLTFGGVGGLVVGMASKDWLANFFGGFMLMLDKPFREGDWICSPDRKIEGTVERIGWRITQVRTFDRRPLFIPNSIFSNIVIETPSNMLNRRVVENFGLRYEDIDKIPDVMEAIVAAFEDHPELDCREPHYARFLKYGESSLDCQVRVHVIPVGRVEFVRMQETVMLMIADAVRKAGADFAYPVVRYKKE